MLEHPGDVLEVAEGQTVRILAGPLQGMDAVFVGPLTPAARVQVLLQFLGRQQQVEVDADAVEPAAPIKRPRRTRDAGSGLP